MEGRTFVGIDPDSAGFVCAYVKADDPKVVTKRFATTGSALDGFVRSVSGNEEMIIAIEGSNGFSGALERALRESGTIFYSFNPADTDRFRKAVLGQNKNNERDAESVARYAMALASQGMLERYRRVWFPDVELQQLTRGYERGSQELTLRINRLWKQLRGASPDLCLLMAGRHPEEETKKQVITGKGFLSLLIAQPDIGSWKRLSAQEMLEAMGGGAYQGRRELIDKLQKVTAKARPVSPVNQLMIQQNVKRIMTLKQDQSELEKILGEVLAGSPAAKALLAIRGIGVITAGTMVAEIIDIRRFAAEDNLASYSGLGMKEHSTGETARMVHTTSYNYRLKDAFMTAAKNYVIYNPEAHLAGYYRNLVKKGMVPMEAVKRVARALVRKIYRTLTAQIESEAEAKPTTQHPKKGEGDMASGTSRGGTGPLSNISPSSSNDDTTNAESPTIETPSRKPRRRESKKERSMKNSA